MTDNKQPAAGATAGGGGNQADGNSSGPASLAEYKKSQQRVRELVEKRRMLERRLVRRTRSLARVLFPLLPEERLLTMGCG
jgi:hypothetical protein